MRAGLSACGLFFVSLVIGCKQNAPAPTAPSEQVLKLFGGEEGLAPLSEPTKVEAFHIDPDVTPEGDDESIGGYRVIDGPVAVDTAIADVLTAALKDSATYNWDMAAGCEFVPGLAVRFTGASSTTDVVFCFQCDELVVFRDGARVGGEDFERARSRLVRLFQQIFRDAEKIQNLQ